MVYYYFIRSNPEKFILGMIRQDGLYITSDLINQNQFERIVFEGFWVWQTHDFHSVNLEWKKILICHVTKNY